jgi:mannitol/fructose-specific phosphotransferase system IIA component (Ntr-type)
VPAADFASDPLPAGGVAMRFEQFLHPEGFIFDLQETNWEKALRRIVHVVAQKGLITNEVPVVAKLMEREKFMTTAIGNRIAIPRCLTDEVPPLSLP